MSTPSVFVEVVYVTSREKQQEAVRLFRRVTDLTAIEVSSGNHYFVIFWCTDELMKNAAEVILGDIDHDAVCTHISSPRTADSHHANLVGALPANRSPGRP